MLKNVAETRWFYLPNGHVTMSFHNLVTDVCVYKTYKNKSAAKAAETKFHNRMARIYG